jgi:predicted nucleotidyltransferase
MLQRAVKILKADPAVAGIFLGGSLADGTADAFSDIDLRLVVTEDRLDEFVRDKQQLAAQFGEVLFFEDMNPRAPYTIAHFSNFVKVDLFIYSFTRLQPSIWLQGNKIEYDPTGQLREIFELSAGLTYNVTQEDVVRWEGKVFAYIHEIYRRTLRAEYYYALTMINHLRSFIVAGWRMEAGRHPGDAWNWAKVEGARTELAPRQLPLLDDWMCGRDQEEIMETLGRMIPEVRRLRDLLRGAVGLERDLERLERIVHLVM